MIRFRVLFGKYNWDIEVCIVVDTPNVRYILGKLENLGCPNDILHKATSRLVDYEDSGFTYTS